MLNVTIEGTALELPDLQATDLLGRCLAEGLPDGSVIALVGPLGAGKTRLVQAVATYSGVSEGIVSSPTFVLLHEYTDGCRPIYHFDAYRLESAEEFRRLSPDDYFEDQGLTFIEWANKFPHVLPAEHLEIQIEPLDETKRRVRLIGFGNRYQSIAQDVLRRVDHFGVFA